MSVSRSLLNINVVQGKKTKGRVKIKMEFIDNKLRRYTTFSKRKTGIMKKVIKSPTNEIYVSIIPIVTYIRVCSTSYATSVS
jgi:hypothetical protein